MSLLIRNARVLTLAGDAGPRRGRALGELGVIPATDILIEKDRIARIAANIPLPPSADVIEADGRVVMPALVDCHTHACWAGDRLDEWDEKLRGTPYLDILARGGGILSTVRAVRAATEEELARQTRARLDAMLRAGTTTVEIKSGYGLSPEAELKILHAIQRAAADWPGTVVPTALLGHAIEGDLRTCVERTIRDALPAVAREFPGITIDAFCEQGAWPLAACLRLFEHAQALGHPIRVHADQFNALGMTPAAVRLGARSVDHLEAATDAGRQVLAESATMAVIVPATGFHTDRRYADGRSIVDAGGAVALASNCNPGSAPTHSLPFVIALAVRFCGLTPAEAISACTINAAALLGFTDRGRLAPGLRADIIILRWRDERLLAYELGDNPVDQVICGGRRVAGG